MKNPLKKEPGPSRYDDPDARHFWLVQRLNHAPWKEQKAFYERAGVKVKSNPFGYGRMGSYELDYMGSAEFEFGTIPAANNRLSEAGKDLVVEQFTHKGITFDFLYIGKEGKPFDAWVRWTEGEKRGNWTIPPFDGKERPRELKDLFAGKDWRGDAFTAADLRTAVWWALDENVLWAVAGTEDEPGHLVKMLTSMADGDPVEFLR